MGSKLTHAQVKAGEEGDQGDNISHVQNYFCLLASALADMHDKKAGRDSTHKISATEKAEELS